MTNSSNPHVMITGFQPFDQDTINPSWMAVDALPAQIEGANLTKIELPVQWFTTLTVLEQTIEQQQPDILMLVGLAAGRDKISLERVGINLCEASIPDNAGVTLADTPIFPEGPTAYFSTLPYRKMKAALDEAGIPAKYSFTAGAFLCNHVLYGSLHLAATRYPQMKVIFVHVPSIPQMAKEGVPVMELETISKALEICLKTAVTDWKEHH